MSIERNIIYIHTKAKHTKKKQIRIKDLVVYVSHREKTYISHETWNWKGFKDTKSKSIGEYDTENTKYMNI